MTPPPANAFSQTLPRNFTFHYDEPPKTPEPIDVDPIDMMDPPEPPRQTFKLKRRRPIPHQELSFGVDGVAVEREASASPAPSSLAPMDFTEDPQTPTIQINAPATPPLRATNQYKPFPGSSSPAHPAHSPISPPRTPIHQMMGDVDDVIEASRCWETHSLSSADETGDAGDWTEASETETEDEASLSRPTTAGGLSFASSLRSQRTIGTNLTSPDQLDQDPMLAETVKYSGRESPTPFRSASRGAPRVSTPKPGDGAKKRKVKFTKAMEAHLWRTYNLYVSDPTHTPFKVFPGQFPSQGVAIRVARIARKSWKGPQPVDEMKLGHWTQNTHGKKDHLDRLVPYTKWPSSDAFVRLKLRKLVAREKELRPYYWRLMQNRTPHSGIRRSSSSATQSEQNSYCQQPSSDFYATSQPPTDYPVGDASSFCTRDMNISLTSSTSATMGYGAPLNQLGVDPTTPRAPEQTFASPAVEDDPMTGICTSDESTSSQSRTSKKRSLPPTGTSSVTPPPPRAQVHQKSQSLHYGFRAPPGLAGLGSPPQLGSPFAPGPSGLRAETIGVAHGFEAAAKRPKLGSPLELAQPVPKRRALVDTIERSETFAAMSASRAPIRNRGYTVDHAAPTRNRRGNVFALFDGVRPEIVQPKDFKKPSPKKRSSSGSRRPSREEPQEENTGFVTGVGLMPPPMDVGPPRLRSPFEPEKHFSTLPHDFGRRRPKTSDGSPSFGIGFSSADVMACSDRERERRRSSLLQITKSRLDNPPNF